MVWVKFKADYDFKPTRQVTIGYLAGNEANVTRLCADRAVAAGKAEVIIGKSNKNNRPAKTTKQAKAPSDSSNGNNTTSA